jgi:hypothetical protein
LGGRGRQISEFEASLVYKVSSRTARATQRNPVSKNKNNNNNNNNKKNQTTHTKNHQKKKKNQKQNKTTTTTKKKKPKKPKPNKQKIGTFEGFYQALEFSRFCD